MSWLEQWSYKVDGVEINDNTTFITQIPELSNMFETRVIMGDIDGDYPVYIRSQPQSGKYTFLIAMATGASPTVFDSRLATLKALFTTTEHVLVVQARGMSASKSLTFIPESMMIDYKQKLVTVAAVAPRPVLE